MSSAATAVHPSIADLREHPVMATAPEELLRAAATSIHVHSVPDGADIFRQGDADTRVFLLNRGRVRFFVDVHGQERLINEVEAPTAFGELAWLDGAPRSATARAHGPATVFVVDPAAATDDPNTMLQIVRELARLATQRLRAASVREVEERDTRERFGKLTILVMIVLSLFTCLAGLSGSARGGVPIYLVAPAIMISIVWTAVAAVRISRRPAATFGLTLKGSGRALLEGAAFSALLVGIYLALGIGLPLDELARTMVSGPRWFAYIIVAVLQELFCRGILQTSYQSFYNDEKGVTSVMLVSLVYGMGHVYLGPGITLASFLTGIPLGFFFLRHRNLLGVVLIHYVAGCLALGLGLLNR